MRTATAFALLVFADMQKELDNRNAVFGKHPLKVIDLVIPLRPDGFGDEVFDPDDQDVFVMRAIEHANLAKTGRIEVNAPQIITRQVKGIGGFERHHPAPLRVERTEDIAYRAVFAAGVHCLKNKQYRLFVFGVHDKLQFEHPLEVFFQTLLCLLLIKAHYIIRVPVRQLNRFFNRDLQFFDERFDILHLCPFLSQNCPSVG